MLLLCTILFPIAAGVAVSTLSMDRRRRRLCYAAVTAVTNLLGLLSLLWGAPVRLFPLAEGIDFRFALDGVGTWILCAAMLLYTASGVYAFEYMNMEEREEVFFAFWFASYGAVLAACMAGNLPTLYLCFEMATLASMPLVLHEGTREAVAAALKYLFYSIGGALLGLFAVMVLCYYGGVDANVFVPGGFLSLPGGVLDRFAAASLASGTSAAASIAAGSTPAPVGLLRAAVFCGIVGFGAKAGMYPLHGWLPAAHPIAPAPASALLSGMIAKLGILAVIRLVYFSAGAGLLRGSWVQTAWMILAMTTIFMGSMMAFREPVMKKRLAYSSISQISYIMLGLSLLNEGGFIGGLIHLAAHAVSKGALFLCAGVFIYRLGRREASELRGIGRQTPVTMWCFLFASLSLIGIPPMGGFVSKWFIALAAVGDGMGVLSVLPPVVLLISALLTAGYLLPVVVDAFFPGKEYHAADPRRTGGTAAAPLNPSGALRHLPLKREARQGGEPPLMIIPLIVLCAAALCVGLFGSTLAESLRGFAAGLF